MAAVKSLPALIFSADYIVLLVLLDQGVYYENYSHMFRFIYKQFYNIWVIFRLISVFETTALLNLPVYSIFVWFPLPDLIGPLMRL